MKVSIAGIIHHSSNNGPGVRYVLFLQGCPHHCPGCQNPETWDISTGKMMETEDIVNDILSTEFIDGVTLSGGDPLYQAEAVTEILKVLKARGIDVWSYTGWTFEAIIDGKAGNCAIQALQYIDVLVDGPFVLKLLSDKCIYRGSTNQRLIDVKKSLTEGKAVELSQIDYRLA